MAISLSKGQIFGSTEQVTNTKLHNLVDNATVSGAMAIYSATLTSMTSLITIAHNLANSFPIYQFYSNGASNISPDAVSVLDNNTLLMDFSTAIGGASIINGTISG